MGSSDTSKIGKPGSVLPAIITVKLEGDLQEMLPPELAIRSGQIALASLGFATCAIEAANELFIASQWVHRQMKFPDRSSREVMAIQFLAASRCFSAWGVVLTQRAKPCPDRTLKTHLTKANTALFTACIDMLTECLALWRQLKKLSEEQEKEHASSQGQEPATARSRREKAKPDLHRGSVGNGKDGFGNPIVGKDRNPNGARKHARGPRKARGDGKL